jgi:hypothetical protein
LPVFFVLAISCSMCSLNALLKSSPSSLRLTKISLASWLKVWRPCLDHPHVTKLLLLPLPLSANWSPLVALVNLGDWNWPCR